MVVERGTVFDAKSGLGAMQREKSDLDQNHHHIEQVVQILDEQGLKSTPFAVVGFNSNGKVQVHASRSVRGFLDKLLIIRKFEEAHLLSLQQACTTSSPTAALASEEFSSAKRTLHIVEDELIQKQQPSAQATSGGPLPTARPLGRSELPRDLSPIYLPYTRATVQNDASDGGDHRPAFTKHPMKSFRIGSKADVTAYLESRLKLLQQLAGKKIAKAWIKGICPKKQARFPYQNNKRHAETGELPQIPGWWPQENGVCRFVEPDHIRREERMQLCLHLLRLRPTPQQLRTWNYDTTEDNKTHVSFGWTAFLKELAGPDLFDDLPKEGPKRTKLRQTLLAQMYDVAAQEEQFENGEIDGGSLHFCEVDEEEERRPTTSKRSRRLSVISTDGDASSPSSCPATGTRVKRVRQDSKHADGQIGQSCELDAELTEDQELNQEQYLPPGAGINRPCLDANIRIVPAINLSDSISSNDTPSPWTNVLPQSQHDHAPISSSGMPVFASSDLPAGMISRKRALKAQRQVQMNQFSDPFGVTPIKQEVQPITIQSQDQMHLWHAPSSHHWINVTSPFCSAWTDPNIAVDAYSVPLMSCSEPPHYEFQHYALSSVGHSTDEMCSSQMYPTQSLPGPDLCTPPVCCTQADHEAKHTATNTPSGEFLLSAGLETLNVDLQQTHALESWQHPIMPERHIQSRHSMPEFFYAGPGAMSDNQF